MLTSILLVVNGPWHQLSSLRSFITYMKGQATKFLSLQSTLLHKSMIYSTNVAPISSVCLGASDHDLKVTDV